MTVGERIKNRRKQLKMSVEKLGELVGKNRATIYRYESNDIENMPYDVIVPLAKALNVSPAYLMGWEEVEQKQLMTEYDYFPVSVAAGLPTTVDGVTEDSVEKITIPDVMMGKYAGRTDVYLMRVNGESMNNVIPDDSLIAVKKIELSDLRDGEIVVYSYDNEYSVKRFYNDKANERLIFRPDSTDKSFVDFIVCYEDAKKVRIHGRVVIYLVEL